MRIFTLAVLALIPAPLVAEQPAPMWPSPLPFTCMPAGTSPPLPATLPISTIPAAAAPLPDDVLPAGDSDARPIHLLELLDGPPRTLNGQQHWISVNFGVGQPMAGRVGVKVLSRDNNSLWLEAYGGAALFNSMYGFGARIQHTALTLGNGDNFFISPGLGTQILPDWYDSDGMGRDDHRRGYFGSCGRFSTLYFLAADVDFSWLHDFTPRFGFELGLKLGVAGRLAGAVGDDYPGGVMWGRNFYPLAALYGGFRF